MGIPILRALQLGLVLGALPGALAAQSAGVTTSDLKGVVRSPQGEPVPGAALTLRRADLNGTWTTTSDGAGRYRFRMLPAGNYLLKAKAKAEHAAQAPVTLQVGGTAQQDLMLASSVAEQTVAVEAPGDSERTQVASVVDESSISNLPINLRNFAGFSLTTPFAAVGNLPAGKGSPDSGLSFAGMTPRQNAFLLDGLDNNDLGLGAPRSSLSQEAVQEFQVISGGFSAEHGRALGGIVNTVTKQGTNELKGSLFWFSKTGSLDATSTTSAEHRQQYGASVGGPILKDRLFYFAAVERMQRTDQNIVAIDPAVAGLIRASGFQLETGKLPFEEGDSSGFLRLDWVQNSSSRWIFRVLAGQSENENEIPWGGLTARSAGGARSTRDQTFTLAHQWAGSAWFNDFRLMFADRDTRIDSLDPQRAVYVEILGAAYFGTQRLADQRSRIRYTQLADTLSTVRGNHTLKGGIDLLHSENDATVPQNFSGVYRFQAIPEIGIGSSMAAFAAPNPFGGTGIPVAFVQSYGNPHARFTARSEAIFIQDDWQAHPAFLLKMGLRFERESLPPFPDTADYGAVQHPPSTVDPVLGPTQLPAGAYDYPANFRIQRDWSANLVHPRLSFSWQARPTLRMFGGAGRFGGPTNLGPYYGLRLFNGRDVQTVIRTLRDPVLLGPLPSWANADGVAQNHRYATLPPGPTTFVLPGDTAFPTMWQENLGLEWIPRPAHRFALELVHSKAKGFMNVRDVNAFQVYFNPATSQPVLRRPDLRYSTLNRVDGSGRADYDGQSLAWTWKRSGQFLLNASYTHSHAWDNFTDWTSDFTPQNTFDPSSEWGPSLQHQAHRLSAAAVWSTGQEGPALRRDWTFSGILHWASGRPYTQLAGSDANYDGDGTSDRPAGVGRNSEATPSTSTLDLRASRTFSFSGSKLELILEVFNCFNRSNVLQVQNVHASVTPEYGTPIRYGPKRQLQFGARYKF
ncbi:MAG: carboxypeptidase regulatory-like domain-containing protein [Holophagaceae bacterium]|nr:carboxypeptidase regulatory-like domain-containing protein [Holophagaceae bacterium]